MVCPPVRGHNPRVLASVGCVPYRRTDRGITNHTALISADPAQYEIFGVKFAISGNGGKTDYTVTLYRSLPRGSSE